MAIEKSNISDSQVSLPERYEKLTVATMLPGERAFVVPWTLWFDLDGKGWMSSQMGITNQRSGTSEMQIARLHDGFVADIERLGRTWSRQYKTSADGCRPESSIAVIGLITNVAERQVVDAHLRKING